MVEDGNICLVISRVFGDSSPFTSLSSIIKGIRWAVSKQKVKVVNLSLTGGDYSVSSDRFFKRLATKKGVIVVAASGNGGNSATSYPAGYDSVVSVGAIDENKKRASFSQYNSMVDFTAPGVDIMVRGSIGILSQLQGSTRETD
jgi:subtilisin family serine protease